MSKFTEKIYRRDVLGYTCVRCEADSYIEVADSEDVSCPTCGDVVHRWSTKKEMMSHEIAVRFIDRGLYSGD